MKRFFALLMAALLLFGNTAFAVSHPDVPAIGGSKKTVDRTTLTAGADYDPDERVRVVIEMEGEAAIQQATKKGRKFNELSRTEQRKMNQTALERQKKALEEIEEAGVDVEILQQFTIVMNGFSTEVEFGEIGKIEKLPSVKAVYIANEYEAPKEKPDMIYSKDLVEAQKAWREYGFKGEGMVVGVIDTGIDHTHKDMVLSDPAKAKLSRKQVEMIIDEHGLPGQYYSDKVPYGYNYYDQNDEYLDDFPGSSMHGMHVAGTVGANGDEEQGGILGIAPEAQILNLKVFGNDPDNQTTYGDIYIKAIDDGIKLGADVLNMSLGSPAGFVSPDDPEQQAVKRAVENGVFMAISAGNSSMFGDGYFYPLAANPDYGVVGDPGVSYDSMQVASFENTHVTTDSLDYHIEGEKGSAAFLSAGQTPPSVGETYELVDAGLGYPEDYEGKEVAGKFALVQRGSITFVEKALNAQANGAAGVIIYNNTDGVVNMATDPAIVIPQLFMLKTDGEKLARAIQSGKPVTITFTGGKTAIPNPEAGLMSDFTSWGLAPNLDFKPEITAPGGQILSTLHKNQYGLMSGTSMAAPHVSGGATLVLERVMKEFAASGSSRVRLAKNLLMNTAKVIEYEGAPVSPRSQGAGIMQLHAALSTPVMVTHSKTNEAKVALKEITGNRQTFELQVENFSDKPVTYEVKANAQTDSFASAAGFIVVAPKILPALELEGVASVNGREATTVTVPAKGTATIEVEIDLSAYDRVLKTYYKNGYWVEGFVTLTDPSDIHPTLSVPYVGFRGEWDDAPIFDDPLWDPDSYYGFTGVGTSIGDGVYQFLGEDWRTGNIDPEKIAFSPNRDGKQDDAVPVLSFLRNAREIKIHVLDEERNRVRTLASDEYIRKNLYDSGRYLPYTVTSDWAWDGMIDGKPAPEGNYYLQVEGVIDFEGAEWQSLELPVKLDVTAPQVEASYDESSRKVTVVPSDNLSGVAWWDLRVNGKSVLSQPYGIDQSEHVLEQPLAPGDVLTVAAGDYAGNEAEKTVWEEKDLKGPEITLLSPEPYAAFNKKSVEVKGYVTDQSAVRNVKVDGKTVKTAYNEQEGRYEFSTTVKPAKDGEYRLTVTATDEFGNSTKYEGTYYIDTTKAKLNVIVKGPKKTSAETAKITVKIQDNFQPVTLKLNGETVYTHAPQPPYGKKGFNGSMDFELALEKGKNEFVFEVTDVGGNVTTEKIIVEKTGDKGKGSGGILSFIYNLIVWLFDWLF
jgi:Subtilase family./Fn3-like domain (DUF1034).